MRIETVAEEFLRVKRVDKKILPPSPAMVFLLQIGCRPKTRPGFDNQSRFTALVYHLAELHQSFATVAVRGERFLGRAGVGNVNRVQLAGLAPLPLAPDPHPDPTPQLPGTLPQTSHDRF